MSETFEATFREEMAKLSLTPSSEQTEKFELYHDLLKEYNKKINLISEKSSEDITGRHFTDSLAPMACIPGWKENYSKGSLIDVGTGAGFPGIPLKIMNPELSVTLLDSLKKRTAFLEEAITDLGLMDVEIVDSRAEDAGRDDKYRERYDICASRAVARLAVLCEYCLPFVKVGGIFIAYKSEDIEEELEAAKEAVKLLGGEVEDVINYNNGNGKRTLVVIEKKEKTPEKYPRRAGKPEKKPL